MSFKDLQLSKTEVVQGVCPTCTEKVQIEEIKVSTSNPLAN